MLYELIAKLNNILYSPPLLIAQIIIAFISVGLFIFYVRLLFMTQVISRFVNEWREGFSSTPVRKGRILKMWGSVQRRMETNDESEWKLAIIEADSIMDEIIKQLGYGGDTMGERMKKMNPGQFPYLDDAWRAHKVRNFIAHDASYRLQRATAQRVIEIYSKIFSGFNVV